MALSDPGGILASPFTIINRRDEAADIAAIRDIVSQHQVERVIAGLPRSMDGSEGGQAEKVRAFVGEMCRHLEVPVEFRDERLTTVSARRLKRSATRKSRGKARYDAMAAAVILQSYLDEGPPGQTPMME